MKKLNIVFLDLDDIKNPLLNGGQARSTFEVSKRLVKLGHKVTVIASKYPGFKDRKEEGIFYKHIGLGTDNIKINNAMFILSVPFAVRKIKADLIIECFTAPVSTLLSPLVTKIPVIVLPSMFKAEEFTRKYKIPFYLLQNFAIKYYKYMMPYSDVDMNKAKTLNPNLVTKVVSQGVGPDYFKIKNRTPKHILFLGRFDNAQKGIDLLLNSYAKVADKIAYPLVIAGHGPDEGKIKDQIKKLKLEGKVTIVNGAYGQKKVELMADAAFVAFPSRHDEMCLWVLEALAAGLPIICFDLEESKWLTSKVSIKAKKFNQVDYSKILVKATQSELNKKMQIDSRAFARNFSWDKVVSQYTDFFKFVLTQEGRI